MIQNGNSAPADKNGQFDHDAAVRNIGKIISFLRNLMTETLAKRPVGIVLIAVGVSNDRGTELTGLCDRSVRELRKKIKDGNADGGLFHVGGGGRKGKLKDVEYLMSPPTHTLVQRTKYRSVRRAARQVTAANNRKDTLECPFT
jgi:hypothetical protein